MSNNDNVFVTLKPIDAGFVILCDGRSVRVMTSVPMGHKIARRNIAKGEKIIKCGFPIGSVSEKIECGAHVHLHNLQSDYTATYFLKGTSSNKEEVDK